MENANKFQVPKVQFQVAEYFLDFFQFQPGATIKSDAYKESVYYNKEIHTEKYYS